MNEKGLAHLLIIIFIPVIVLLLLGLVLGGVIKFPGSDHLPITPAPTPAPTSYEAEATDSTGQRTEYQNPFEEKNENPFESYDNPFNAL